MCRFRIFKIGLNGSKVTIFPFHVQQKKFKNDQDVCWLEHDYMEMKMIVRDQSKNYFHLNPKIGPLCPPPPTTFSVPERNTGKCFERPAKIFMGRQRFGDNLRGGGGAGVLTIWF